MIAAIQLLEYLHYHFTPRIYVTLLQCKHMIQRHYLNARKQADLSTKNETKQTCFLQQIPACTIRQFKTSFHR